MLYSEFLTVQVIWRNVAEYTGWSNHVGDRDSSGAFILLHKDAKIQFNVQNEE